MSATQRRKAAASMTMELIQHGIFRDWAPAIRPALGQSRSYFDQCLFFYSNDSAFVEYHSNSSHCGAGERWTSSKHFLRSFTTHTHTQTKKLNQYWVTNKCSKKLQLTPTSSVMSCRLQTETSYGHFIPTDWLINCCCFVVVFFCCITFCPDLRR